VSSLSVISVAQRLATLVSVITSSGLNACASTRPVAYQGLSSARECRERIRRDQEHGPARMPPTLWQHRPYKNVALCELRG
jgi:hypothetical protein